MSLRVETDQSTLFSMLRSPISIIFIITAAVATCLANAAEWAHKNSDVAVDSAVRYGVLENGMRYALMENSEPPGQVSLRLHVSAGSLHEAENQRGLAHFLEHMAFNGSKNFPDVEALIPQMQRLGISFGAHANAYTSYDETVYMLDLPNAGDEVVDLAFTVMRDFADGLLIEADEIEKERGVVQSELQSRDSVQRRLFEKQFKFLLPDFLATKRMPIGLEEVILNAPRERFVEFYEQHYVPSRMSFIAVGDFDAAAFEQQIKEAFTSIQTNEAEPPALDMGEIPKDFTFQTAVFTDEEVSQDEVSLSALKPYSFEEDTVENRTKRLPLSIANSILKRRFQILAKKEGAPISGGSASYSNWLSSIQFIEASVTPEEGKWDEAIPILEQEIRRVLEYGFSQAELDEIRANLLNSFQEAAKRAPTRKSSTLASGIVKAIHKKRVYSHPEENLRIYEKGLAGITPEACHAAFKEAWEAADLNLILTSKSADQDTDKQLTQVFKDSQAVAIEAPEKEVEQQFAYTEFGTPGTVKTKHHVEDLDFTQLVLSNEVRVNLKQTDFQKNSILITARFGSGTLTKPKEKTGLGMVAHTVMNGGGLCEHSHDDLKRIFAGKNVDSSFRIGDDAFNLSGSTTPEDLELQLQLMCATLTDPGYRDEALRQFQKQIPALASQLKHTLGGAMADLTAWSRGNDGRFAKPDPDRLIEYTNEDAQAWIAHDLTDSYLELTIVGDFEMETALPLILNTFGALPKRTAEIPAHSEERKIRTPDYPTEKTFTYDSKIDKAVAMISWKCAADSKDVKESRRMNILAKILSDRLRKTLREELGSTYSPRASFSMSQVFGTAYLTSSSIATSAETELLNQKMLEIGQNLATEGATQDELDRALTPILEDLDKHLRENSHWLGTILSRSQAQPYRLDWAREREADYASINLDDVNTLAAKYLHTNNAAVLTLKPETIDPDSL